MAGAGDFQAVETRATANLPRRPQAWGGNERRPRVLDCYPRRIESKNSALLLVALILSRRNSIAERCRSFLGGRRLGAGTSGDLESSTAIRAASSRRTLRCSWWL